MPLSLTFLGTDEMSDMDLEIKYDDYNDKWANRDETLNFDQKYDKQLARELVMPEVQKTLTEEVDNMIKQELENMKTLSG